MILGGMPGTRPGTTASHHAALALQLVATDPPLIVPADVDLRGRGSLTAP
jgi:hypothetical protein